MKQPSKDNVLKAHSDGCDDVKKAIENLWPDEFKSEYDKHKVYAYHDNGIIYMLSKSVSGYNIIDCHTGNCLGSEYQQTAEECLENWATCGDGWQPFDNQKDFFKWALKIIS